MSSVVYRVFDAADRLLYVGVTADPVQRFSFHESQTPWWYHVRRVELSQEFESRQDAEDAEALAISRLAPLLNRHQPHVPQSVLQLALTFSPYEYEPQPNLEAAIRGTFELDPQRRFEAQRAAMELAFKPFTDAMSTPHEPGAAS